MRIVRPELAAALLLFTAACRPQAPLRPEGKSVNDSTLPSIEGLNPNVRISRFDKASFLIRTNRGWLDAHELFLQDLSDGSRFLEAQGCIRVGNFTVLEYESYSGSDPVAKTIVEEVSNPNCYEPPQ